MTIKNKLISIILAGALAEGCGESLDERAELCTGVFHSKSGTHIKKLNNSDLEDGFVDPNGIVVEIVDQDGDKKREVVLNYEGKRYLMKEDSIGVYLQQYEIIPTRIEPAKIVTRGEYR